MQENFSFVLKNLAGGSIPGNYPHSLQQDLLFLKSKGITSIITLTEGSLEEKIVAENELQYLHLSVKDYYPPNTEQILKMVDFVNSNEVCYIHCAAGRGRTGTMLACYLVSTGEYTADQAINHIRELRKGSIQTYKQEDSIKEYEQYLLNTKS